MNQNTQPRIRTEDAIAAFDSAAELARTLGIKPQAITSWGEHIPTLRAYQLREMFPERFGGAQAA